MVIISSSIEEQLMVMTDFCLFAATTDQFNR